MFWRNIIDTIRLRLIICLFVGFVAGCSGPSKLQAERVVSCLNYGEEIELVSSCIERLGEYQKSKSKLLGNIPLYRITDICNKYVNTSCSNSMLSETLSVGEENIHEPGNGENQGKLEVILNPYKLFLSRSQNLGGRHIMLYVFYDEETGRVVGWINLGSVVDRYNFNKKGNTIKGSEHLK